MQPSKAHLRLQYTQGPNTRSALSHARIDGVPPSTPNFAVGSEQRLMKEHKVDGIAQDEAMAVGFHLEAMPPCYDLHVEKGRQSASRRRRRSSSVPSTTSEDDRNEIVQSSQRVYVVAKAGTTPGQASQCSSGRRRRQRRSFSMYMSSSHNAYMLRKNLTALLSYIYAIFLVVFGGILTMVRPMHTIGSEVVRMDHVFITTACLVGLLWLVFLHFDLTRYELRMRKERDSASRLNCEPLRAGDMYNWFLAGRQPSGYSFLTGRHSGSFYLKGGMTVFCCGHLIHEGLLLGQEIIAWVHSRTECGEVSVLMVHIVTPIFSFYQLFFMFKYSNVNALSKK